MSSTEKPTLALRRLVVCAGIVGSLLFAGTLVDALFGGPYTSWYHDRMFGKAKAASLIGRSEAEVVEVLGQPSEVYPAHSGPNGEFTVGFDYRPVPIVPYSPFTVFVRDGGALCVESFDRETHSFDE